MNKFLEIPSKFYMDIDINLKTNSCSEDWSKIVDNLIYMINKEVKLMYDIESTKNNVLILDATHSGKFSNHLVFEKIIFCDNLACKYFIQHFIDKYKADLPVVMDSHLRPTMIFDTVVYSKNQNFRIVGSSKFGKSIPFKASVSYLCNDKELFMKSLISDRKLVVNTHNIVLDCPSKPRTSRKPETFKMPPQKTSKMFKYPEIENYVNSLIGNCGEIRKIVEYPNKNTNQPMIIYEISGYRGDCYSFIFYLFSSE